MRKQIARLARAIDEGWRKASGRIAAFTSVAVRALERVPIEADEAAIAAWTLSTSELPEECNPFGDAGPAAFTVHRGDGFVLNLYVYATPDLFIHDHGFAGAFVNLRGDSLHCLFRFDTDTAPGAGVLAGRLALHQAELLRPGMVAPLIPGPSSAHRVWHLGRPTIVLVARTLEAQRGLVQYKYDAPGLATRIVRPPPYGPEVPLAYRKRTKMLELLRQTNPAAAGDYLGEVLRSSDAWSAAAHTLDQWDWLERESMLSGVLGDLRKRHGVWVDALPAVRRGLVLHRSIDWNALVDDGARLLLALLLTFPNKAAIADWIQKVHPGVDADEAIVSWLRAAWESSAVDTALDDAGVAILRALLRGHRGNALLTALRKDFALDTSTERQVLKTAREIARVELFKPLLA
ncbi:MAG TPA: hypothetical protein VGH20_01250 [Myxococcales bacterium]|jgi:hypothetical protein